MAARKSCTHLTWSEAKNKSGIGSSGQQKKKNKEASRKQNHGQVLAAKIITKHHQGGGGGAAAASAADNNRKLAKAYRKQEEKAASLASKRAEEREQKRLESLQEVKLYDKAKEKLSEIMQELRDSRENDELPAVEITGADDDDEHEALHYHQERIVECKQMQVDELMALEAMMIPDEEDDNNNDFFVSNASKLPELKDKLEQYNNNSGGCDNDDNISSISASSSSLRLSIVNHPPISFYMKLEVDDYRGPTTMEDHNNEDNYMKLNAMILLRVTFPPMYLNNSSSSSSSSDGVDYSHQSPIWDVEYVMVTDKLAMVSADKPLESLAYINKKELLLQAMNKHAQEDLLPYPCVYQVVCEWLSENIFEYLTMHPHVLLATK